MKIALFGREGRMGSTIRALIPEIEGIEESPLSLCDVMIDISSPQATAEVLDRALERRCPLVIGTTGLVSLDPLKAASKTIPLLYAPNFSLGILALKKAAECVTSLLEGATLHIIENHHLEKKDSPSGTALHLRESLGKGEIFSMRTPETIGTHTLIFTTLDEEITLTHRAKSRTLFARGALIAAQRLSSKPAGFYGLQDII